MSFSERIEQLDRQIQETVERAVRELRDDIQLRLREGQEGLLDQLQALQVALPSSYLTEEDLKPLTAETATRSRGDALAEVHGALADVDQGRSQSEILGALLAGAGRFAARTAVFLVRPDEIRGWGGHGFGESEDRLRELRFPPGEETGWGRFLRGRGAVRLRSADRASLSSQLEIAVPSEAVLVPMVLRDRLAAALYADRGGGDPPLLLEPVEILVFAAALAIENLPFRRRTSTPTLRLEEAAPDTESGLEPWSPPRPAAAPAIEPPSPAPAAEPGPRPQPGFAPAPAVEEEVASEFAEPAAEEIPTLETVEEEAPETVGEEIALELEPPVLEEPDLVVEESDLVVEEPDLVVEDSALSDVATAGEEPGFDVSFDELPAEESLQLEEPEAEAGWAAETGEEEPAVAAPESEGEELSWPEIESPVATTETPTEEATEPPAAPATPLPESAPAAAATAETGPILAAEEPPGASSSGPRPIPPAGNPMVQPPADIQGPGWAFTGGRSATGDSDDPRHEDARRLARLLVSEIKLYNEEQVEEGRKNRDIYERLREDIDRSRQIYEERVDSALRESTDYFYQELVRVLGSGDPKALGI